jgi:ABC-type transport system substrate-binding protein
MLRAGRLPALTAALMAALIAGLAAALPAAAADEPSATGNGKKVFRYAFRIAEAGFDPAKISDLYSRTITPHIFESLYQYDPLARPAKVRPLTAAGMPEVSADYRTWTVKLRPGIYFASDPAFKGQRRELVAEDYVYSMKRFADPANNSPAWPSVESAEILGLREARQAAADGKQPFDYARPIEGLRALDRYTIQYKLRDPSPRFITNYLAATDLHGAVAREVVDFYGAEIPGHPVGTGPFKLVQWRRSSLIALERSPDFREVLYDAEPAADDAEGQAILKRLKGRKLPMIDRVEVSIIDENQPRWLTFLQQRSDFLEEVPPEFIALAMPGGKVAPNLARQGVQGFRMVRADIAFTYFNMEDPVVGGYTPDKVALRRAIGLAIDVPREIALVRRNQAIVAQSMYMPNTSGYEPSFRSENGEYSPAKAKALLDLYGYVDKDGDGWRDLPDGSPLVLNKSTQPDQANRQLDEQWARNMKAINVRIRFLPAKFQENLKAGRAGSLQMWGLGLLAAEFDSQASLNSVDSRHLGGNNYARFKLPAMDALIDKATVLPDGPERVALFKQAQRLTIAYMPYKVHVHRYINDLAHPWVVGYRRPVFWQDFWQYIDIDGSRLPAP